MTAEDRLDAALDSDLAAFAASPEVRELAETAAEIGGALAEWRVDSERRARIYATAMANAAGPTPLRTRLRALGVDRRVQAIAGGGVVTLAAAAALAVAVARGRRHAPASALGA